MIVSGLGGKGRGDGHDQSVAMADMAQLMGHDAGDLVAAEQIEQTGRSGDSGVLGIAARGKGIGLRIIHHINLGHRQVCAPGKLLNQAIEFRRRLPVHLAGAMHAQYHLVGIPIGKHIHANGHHKCDDHALLAAKQITHGEKQAGHGGQQQTGAHGIHGTDFSLFHPA